MRLCVYPGIEDFNKNGGAEGGGALQEGLKRHQPLLLRS